MKAGKSNAVSRKPDSRLLTILILLFYFNYFVFFFTVFNNFDDCDSVNGAMLPRLILLVDHRLCDYFSRIIVQNFNCKKQNLMNLAQGLIVLFACINLVQLKYN